MYSTGVMKSDRASETDSMANEGNILNCCQ